MSDSHYIPVSRYAPSRYAMVPPWRSNPLARLAVTHLLPPLSILAEQLTSAARIVPESWNKFLFRRFWGENSLSDASLVIDSYENVVLRNRFKWTDSGRSISDLPSGDVVQGTFSPQATAMLTSWFWRHTGKGLRIATDVEEVSGRAGAIICYGSADSNFKAFEIEAQSGGFLCQLTCNDAGERGFRVGGRVHAIEARDGRAYDKAIVLRLTGQRDSVPSHVVCAGLSEWGSLAAVHYLTRGWKALHKRFDSFGQRRDFCVVLEVPVGQFEDAWEIASAVCWQSDSPRDTR